MKTIRKPVTGLHGMVATSEPQAAQAGLDILKKGGNAIDAAICVAACLTVTEPTSNGIGGDNFAIVSKEGKLYGLNASGYAPKSLSKEALMSRGVFEIPKFGFIPVTVPGAVKGWKALHERFGKLDFKEVLAPAISYAKNGFIVQHTVAKYWNIAYQIYKSTFQDDPLYKHWFDTFTFNDKAPNENEKVVLLDHAKTLEDIANTYGDSFYHGHLADLIDTFSKQNQGFISKSDLDNYQAQWVEPIHTTYNGYQISEIPPNGQGAIALMALNIMEHLKIDQNHEIDRYHKQIEAMKLAFADGLKYISDPKTMKVNIKDLLDKNYALKRSLFISDSAMMPLCGTPIGSGTVYLATADCEGNMVSMIQSNYMGFGSGLVVPHTGIALHNRGHNFNLDASSDNFLYPLKQPYHTIIPGFITKDNKPLGPFGVMGGFMQPQGHLQVLMNMIDFKMNVQEALDAPRWQWIEKKKITVEPEFPKDVFEGLKNRGHDISIDSNIGSFGRGQIILWDEIKKVYIGGTEKRCDGTICSY